MTEPDRAPSPETARPDLTSLHVRQAGLGDALSLDWVIKRFSPLLLAQAAWRLGPELRVLYDPEDLVNDVWAVTLPKLSELPARDGRSTPVLLKFLATTLLYRVNNLVKKHVTGAASRRDRMSALSELPLETSGVVTQAVHHEIRSRISAAIEELDSIDRQVIILRGIEQNSNETAALVLGISENAASMRYQRALMRLRAHLPGSVFEDLGED